MGLFDPVVNGAARSFMSFGHSSNHKQEQDKVTLKGSYENGEVVGKECNKCS